jgi:hypothetical protein
MRILGWLFVAVMLTATGAVVMQAQNGLSRSARWRT